MIAVNNLSSTDITAFLLCFTDYFTHPGNLQFFRGDTMTTGMRIAKLRNRNGWSQSRLAKEIKTNVSTIQKWETDGSFPSALHIKALAVLFNTSSDYLLCLDNRPMLALNEFSPAEAALIEDITQALKNRRPF